MAPQASRRTRAAASTTTAGLGDENKVSAANGATGKAATKNAGLALKGKTTATAAAAAAPGGQAAKRRTALADSSNKVPQHQHGGGAKNAKNGGKLTVLAEEPGPKSRVTTRNSSTARQGHTAAAAGKEADGDAIMSDATTTTRPIKSLRSSTTSVQNPAASSGVLAGKPTNIPRQSVGAGSTKNAGLKRSLRNSTAPAPAQTAAPAAKPATTSTKNAGLRLKREIQQVVPEEESKQPVAGKNGHTDVHAGVRAAEERRKSKRLRASDPHEVDEAMYRDPHKSQHPSTSDSSILGLDEEKIASVVGNIIDVSSDEEDVRERSRMIDSEDEDDMIGVPTREDGKDAGWEDLDAGDEEDPLMVAEYVKEIHDYMKELELTTMADPNYMNNQTEITWKMRSILVDWLVEVHGKFRLLPETIFLAVNIVDRMLSIKTVSMLKFQLIGITSLFIASKYEEVFCPSVQSFLYMTDGGYSDEELLIAERYILRAIDFNLSYPNPINFLRRISKADGYDIQTRTVAKYFLEVSVVDRKFLDKPPSLIAAAGMWLARKVLDRGLWDANLVHYSTYSQGEILPTAQLMLDYVLRQIQLPNQEAEHPHFHKKYSAKKFYRASELVKTWCEDRYVLKRDAGLLSRSEASRNALFNGLEGGGRLEEWEDEGGAAHAVDFN